MGLGKQRDVGRFVRLFSEPGFLWKDAALVLTDGRLQEETTALGIPCLTLREQHRTPHHHRTRHQHPGRHHPGIDS
jgi:hypothetical protein